MVQSRLCRSCQLDFYVKPKLYYAAIGSSRFFIAEAQLEFRISLLLYIYETVVLTAQIKMIIQTIHVYLNQLLNPNVTAHQQYTYLVATFQRDMLLVSEQCIIRAVIHLAPRPIKGHTCEDSLSTARHTGTAKYLQHSDRTGPHLICVSHPLADDIWPESWFSAQVGPEVSPC